ncbi:hypothetical protein SEUCBS140593_001352 [Sporothrix eucalyptigena]|uniref:Uncharacterized protein n=1 Tax=Sporothrix eucalyptigena TaxID=1812306 RepID=A0ABP0AXH6_9PEZI
MRPTAALFALAAASVSSGVAADNFLSDVTSVVGVITSDAVSVATNIASHATSVFGDVTSGAVSVATNVASHATSGFDKLTSEAASVATNVASKATSAAGNVASHATSVAGDATSAAGAAGTAATSAAGAATTTASGNSAGARDLPLVGGVALVAGAAVVAMLLFVSRLAVTAHLLVDLLETAFAGLAYQGVFNRVLAIKNYSNLLKGAAVHLSISKVDNGGQLGVEDALDNVRPPRHAELHPYKAYREDVGFVFLPDNGNRRPTTSLETIFHGYLRAVLGAYRSTPIHLLYTEAGIPPLKLYFAYLRAVFLPRPDYQMKAQIIRDTVLRTRPIGSWRSAPTLARRLDPEEAGWKAVINRWKIRWQDDAGSGISARSLAAQTPCWTAGTVRRRHLYLTKAESGLLTQIRTGHVGLCTYLYCRQVMDQPTYQCGAGGER